MSGLITTIQERWLPVVGWKGLYEIGDLGHVRSVDRWVADPRYPSGQRFIAGKEMTQTVNSSGYYVVGLNRSNRQYNYYVHTLVLNAFVGPCPEGKECCHGDEGPLINKATNLRWGTSLENHADRVRLGHTSKGRRVLRGLALIREPCL